MHMRGAPRNCAKARPYPVRKGGWPHPTFSRRSANAFLKKSRPHDEELALLVGAFRPLPPRTLSKRQLASGFAHAAKTLSFLFALWETEARYRASFFGPSIAALMPVMRWAVDELQAPGDQVSATRRKLDRRNPKLSAAMSVHLAAQRAGIRPPSAGELAALAVLHGPSKGGAGEAPDPDDARRRVFWRTVRRRASRLARLLGPVAEEVHAQHLDGVKADLLAFYERLDEHRAAIDALERESAALLVEERPTKRGTKRSPQ